MGGFRNPFRNDRKESRPRNPRFAPEFLERRLSPSALLGSFSGELTCEVMTADPEPSPDGNGDPVIDQGGVPPVDDVTGPR